MSIHQQVMDSMAEMVRKMSDLGIKLQLPPPSNQILGTEYTAIDRGKSLSARFLFDRRFTNPVNMFQGGFLCGAFDEVFGPLTYMAAGQPVVTLQMSTTFVRPFTAKDEFIIVTAELVAKTKTVLVLRGEARTKDGKLVATADNHSLVITDANLKKTQEKPGQSSTDKGEMQ